jgi:hypothetical protein
VAKGDRYAYTPNPTEPPPRDGYHGLLRQDTKGEEIKQEIHRQNLVKQEIHRQNLAGGARQFETGATRDVDTGKLDYEGFLSPLVLERYAQYMHKNRHMKDGSLRNSDNWQLGIPLDAFIKSKMRHDMDVWFQHRDLSDMARDDLETALCAVLFNTMGYLHELLKKKRNEASL